MNTSTRVVGAVALGGAVAAVAVVGAAPAGASAQASKGKLVAKAPASPTVVQHHTPDHCCP